MEPIPPQNRVFGIFRGRPQAARRLIIPPAQAKVAAGDGTLESSADMDFTRVGRIFAHLFFWYGILGVAFSLYQGFATFKFPEEMMAQSKWLTREIGGAMSVAFMGLALGVLSEISSKRHEPDEQA
jgi:hypothetical protein